MEVLPSALKIPCTRLVGTRRGNLLYGEYTANRITYRGRGYYPGTRNPVDEDSSNIIRKRETARYRARDPLCGILFIFSLRHETQSDETISRSRYPSESLRVYRKCYKFERFEINSSTRKRCTLLSNIY